ncbi:hypothetical protein K402DRAFT_462876 [Aulographum hederae CBS 113979]|uniref:Actin-like ATPase domain-containing protein n=1 Tax=Aulographum hederae CBS 113979 TaxID=1176131 RepID=A0A6G1H1Q2_9PEZI|nr:hypothetical protein K402DRAFT_462876 [Aulographum hederae CBS 113979]
MAPFKDEQIMIIAPGSQTTLAQLGLPESFTPARFRMRSRMFPASKEGEWEPYKVRRKDKQPGEYDTTSGNELEDDIAYEEDPVSEEGAVWPMAEGRITNWPCFFALLTHIYNALNPTFHTPILLVAQPCWTARDHERLTEFFFEKFKMPAFALIDSATATCYAYGVPTATVVDVGLGKADITAVLDFIVHDHGRIIALPKCGGEAMTQRLLELLNAKKFTREMCEQLKKSSICEILPPGVPLPGTAGAESEEVTNPAAAASTGASASGPGHRIAGGAMGDVPLGPGPGTEVGDGKLDEDNEGVLDVASIVTSGNMAEILAKKEREKAEKAASRKKGADAAAAQAKQIKLPNSRKEKATFMYEDHALLDTLKGMNLSDEKMAEAQATLDEGAGKKADAPAESTVEPTSAIEPTTATAFPVAAKTGPIRREIEVGTERFQAASGGILEKIADGIHRTISAVENVNRRSELWESLIILGNGSKTRGFKEALMATIQTKYVISPSSATMFTSELPSNLSTPAGTGANTPQPQLGPHGVGGPGTGTGVNPLLLAATTAQNPHLQPQPPQSNGMSTPGGPPSLHQPPNMHSSHGQTPTTVRMVKVPEYFPEWKEAGYDEAAFLGAQTAAKVLFIVDQGVSKGFMTRSDYNDEGPRGISDYSM